MPNAINNKKQTEHKIINKICVIGIFFSPYFEYTLAVRVDLYYNQTKKARV